MLFRSFVYALLLTELRIGDYHLNSVNRRAYTNKSKSSKYKGVSLDKYSKKWRSMITFNKECYYLGMFDTENEAALAYNNKVIELIGHSNIYLNKIN